MDRTAIKALWTKHGGRQHGPVVEHYVIEQQAFYQFAAELVSAARTPSRNDVLEEAALIVDQCNREGPYNAIGAAKRIRARKDQTDG